MTDPVIAPATVADTGELLTLQRAAYVTEAQLHDDVLLPPLTQTYNELRAELSGSIAVKATVGHRIVGAGRARVDGPVLHIGRLSVAPDQQGRGIGTALLTALERSAPAGIERFALFTGHLSHANIRLYERLGYREVRRERLTPRIELVHLEKELP